MLGATALRHVPCTRVLAYNRGTAPDPACRLLVPEDGSHGTLKTGLLFDSCTPEGGYQGPL